MGSAHRTTPPTAIATLVRRLTVFPAQPSGRCWVPPSLVANTTPQSRRHPAPPACSWVVPQHVAESADGLDQPWLAQLPPQITDVDPGADPIGAAVVGPH